MCCMQLLRLGCLINLNVTTLGVGVLSLLDPSGSLHVMVDIRQTGRIIVYAKESQQCVCRCAALFFFPFAPVKEGGLGGLIGLAWCRCRGTFCVTAPAKSYLFFGALRPGRLHWSFASMNLSRVAPHRRLFYVCVCVAIWTCFSGGQSLGFSAWRGLGCLLLLS